MPQVLLVELVRDGGVTNNSESDVETYTKEKEKGVFAALIKQHKSCANCFCKYFMCLYNYIFSYLNCCFKFVRNQEVSVGRALATLPL